jgi:hypothetical protein
MSFNIQDYLSDMRDELNRKIDSGFGDVTVRADTIAKDLKEHKVEDTLVQNEIKASLLKLNNFYKNMSKFTWTVIGAGTIAFVAFLFDMAKNHFHLI